MTKNIAFLFDLDGVLIDSESEYTRIWEEIERRYPTGKPNFAHSIKGQTLPKILGDNFPDPEVSKEVNILLHQLESEMIYRYCDGAEKFINEIMARNVPRAVVTSSDEVKMAHLYKDIPDFRQKFNVIIDSSSVTRSKPDPEGYIKAAHALEALPKNTAVFEDSVQGVKAGKAAGAFVVGIIGTKTREELLPYSDILIHNLSEIDIDKLCKTLEER